jgi:hypothetical protein
MSEKLSDNALKGKIARLPGAVREQVCKRLHDGQSARKILPWLNALPEVQAVLAAEFEGVPVSDQNLSAWRSTGYADYLRRVERVERTRELAKYAAEVSRANGASIADGAASIASGKLLELLEAVDEATGDAKLDPEALVNISRALAALRGSEQKDVSLGLEKIKVSQKGEELALAREKYQRETCELFLKWHADKRAGELAGADISNADKIEKLGQLMFGDTWQPATEKK